MSAVRPAAPSTAVWVPPVRPGDQGVSAAELPHAERIMQRLFTAPNVDMLVTYDATTGEYELRARTGRVRWLRERAADGALRYVVTQREGVDPTPSMDPRALATLEAERTAAGGATNRSVPRERNSYPRLLERLTQLFDHDRAPDIAIIPKPGGDVHHAGGGSHGVPDVVQSRAPLIIAAPGVARGATSVDVAALEDVAPTMATLLGVAPVVGRDANGVPATQRLRWQDGRSLVPEGVAQAARGVIITVDGFSQTAMLDEVTRGGLPNIARLMQMGTKFRHGALAQYPSVTWPNHHTIVTGATPGHTGIVNNSWYDRAERQERVIVSDHNSRVFGTAKYLEPEVETLYEAVARSFPGARTLAVHQPAGRGASVSTLDVVGIGELVGKLPSILTGMAELWKYRDTSRSGVKAVFKGMQDAAGAAMLRTYYGSGEPPKLAVVEFSQVDTASHELGPHSPEARSAMRTVDAYIGVLLSTLDRRGLTDSTAIILTADHGMEAQDIPADQLSTEDDWKAALVAAAADGHKTIESTRFVYLKTVQVQVTMGARGAASRVIFVRDDDTGPGGAVRAVAGAAVTIRDSAGREVRGVTGADGRVEIDCASLAGELTVTVEHADFSRETSVIA